MRLGVLDVGSNTVHLLVVDAHQGARPLPAFSHKEELHLADHLDAQNRLTSECAGRLLEFVRDALEIAEDKGVQDLVAFATSAVRDAANGDEVLAWIEAETNVAHPGAARYRGVEADLPGRAALVRLVLRAPAAARHRRRLAGDRRWPGRGPVGGGVAAARRQPADQGLAHLRPAGPGRGPEAAQARAGGDRRGGQRDQVGGRARSVRGHLEDLPAAGQDRRRRPVQRRSLRPAGTPARRRHRPGRPARRR